MQLLCLIFWDIVCCWIGNEFYNLGFIFCQNVFFFSDFLPYQSFQHMLNRRVQTSSKLS